MSNSWKQGPEHPYKQRKTTGL